MPEPEKLAADMYVADIVALIMFHPLNDNVEDIGVPFLYISLQFIFPNTSNL